jgi:hypothetical protein
MDPTYYQITTMQKDSPDFCYVRKEPAELGLKSWKLGKGVAFGDEYPSVVRLKMAEEDPGMQLTSFIGNTCGMLVVDRAVCDVMRSLVKAEEVEFLKASIVNHRGRVASNDYYIVNPLGVQDVLNLKKSKIEYLDKDVVGIDELVLDPKKLAGKPHLFRLREEPRWYFASAAMVDAIGNLDPEVTNGNLAEHPEIPSSS